MIRLPRPIRGAYELIRDTLTHRRHISDDDRDVALFVLRLTGTPTRRPGLYVRALTHASCQGVSYDNERLEFLGDSILAGIVGHAVYDLYPDDDEGSLSQLRSYLVSRSRINMLALSLGFGEMIRLGGGIDVSHSDIVGNALEAFIGALYLDKGHRHTTDFVRSKLIISRKSLDESYGKEEDAKTAFIIIMQKHKIPYQFVYTDSHTDDDGTLVHTCDLCVGSTMQVISQGMGTSKKLAHQDAARHALRLLRSDPSILDGWQVPQSE